MASVPALTASPALRLRPPLIDPFPPTAPPAVLMNTWPVSVVFTISVPPLTCPFGTTDAPVSVSRPGPVLFRFDGVGEVPSPAETVRLWPLATSMPLLTDSGPPPMLTGPEAVESTERLLMARAVEDVMSLLVLRTDAVLVANWTSEFAPGTPFVQLA